MTTGGSDDSEGKPGYPPPQQPGYPPQQQHGYPPPQQQHGYPPPQQQHGYPPPQQHGYPPPQPQPGYPPPQHGYPPPPQHGYPPPQQQGYPPPRPSISVHDGIGFVRISLTRAFRLQIDPHEVLPEERDALLQTDPPIRSATLQAFLAWRRSLLFVIAIALVPVTTLKAISTFADTDGVPGIYLGISSLQLAIDVWFTIYVWMLVNRWTTWHRQRRALAKAWLAYFLAPFLVYLFPFRSLLDGEGPAAALLVGMVFSIQAVLTLAPKAISLMPGLLRASIASKLLFPGAAAPGWLILLAAPLYGLLVYVILIMPYQISGSGFFIAGVLGILAAQVWMARTGYRLARPLSLDEALTQVRSARAGYLGFTALGLVFIGVALWDLLSQMQIPALNMVSMMLALFTNVLLLTLVGTDMLIVNLDSARARGDDERSTAIHDVYKESLAGFIAESHARTDHLPRSP